VILEVEAARKQFGGLVAVNDVSFSVKAGEIVGLIGPNGAGKSTTFNLVTGVLSITSGKLNYRGQSLAGLSSREISSRGIARTFQHVRLVPGMSVLENAAMGAFRRGSSRPSAASWPAWRGPIAGGGAHPREARRQLERVGLGDLVDRPAGSLALGQQRILEIARACAVIRRCCCWMNRRPACA
jgi:branched-chain amino acid transport system permease protein